ncbi:MAG: dTDP-4-dehydrorhamnose 3,5-epimerase family protein [Anaerolineae bacterium]|jgi:dTDP-4-dehydrorhamnose 3,5-epimerase|nr:dTDP-4-dehydrorhamnose 3,5-epimerase family protein [Anaerolineae bacterium]
MSTTVITPLALPTLIDGVYTVPIRAFADERGQFMETFRREWFPSINWDKLQTNRSDSKAGVLRGLHYHFYQVDYWFVTAGLIRAGMVDLRPNSPTFRQTYTVELGDSHHIGLLIPIGVAHGFVALTDCTLTYIVNNYYGDGSDERGVAWDDPDLKVPWGIEHPQLSQRDRQNRRWQDIPSDQLPK